MNTSETIDHLGGLLANSGNQAMLTADAVSYMRVETADTKLKQALSGGSRKVDGLIGRYLHWSGKWIYTFTVASLIGPVGVMGGWYAHSVTHPPPHIILQQSSSSAPTTTPTSTPGAAEGKAPKL